MNTHDGPKKTSSSQVTPVYTDIVLDLAAVPQPDARRDDHVLPDVTILSDLAITHNVGEMPYFSSFSDCCALVYDGGLVYEIIFHI